MSEYIVEMKHITKRFPGIVANDDVTIQIKKGEIFALLGENGAGKSTLMSMLFGMYEPDEGEIYIRGEKVKLESPNHATKLNIGMVHQHFKLVSNYTIAENIVMGMEPVKKVLGCIPVVDMKKANQDIRELSEKYGLAVNPTDVISDINVSTQQRVEILKMLYREAEILIFDEPTAVLTPQEIDFLLDIIKSLRDDGKTIILITITVLFIVLMLVVPLLSVIVNSLREGFTFYIESISTEYVRHSLLVTLLATGIAVVVNTIFGICAAWLLTKFSFRGKQILATLIDIPFSISPVIVGLAYLMTFGRLGWFYPVLRAFNQHFGTDVRIAFAIPGVVLATVFVTFPFVSREIIPVLNVQGKDEEEAAALMGAKGFTIFRKITFPHMKWGLIYGIILCTARALGEFGAVNALSKTRGETFTLPLEIDALYMSGTKTSITAAFAVSSILVILAIILLIARNIIEHRGKEKEPKGTR